MVFFVVSELFDAVDYSNYIINQRAVAFVSLGLLSLYMFRTRFVSIIRSST